MQKFTLRLQRVLQAELSGRSVGLDRVHGLSAVPCLDRVHGLSAVPCLLVELGCSTSEIKLQVKSYPCALNAKA